jgi:hypothetical protein
MHSIKRPVIFYYGVLGAFVLWRQRRRARLSIDNASRLVGIDASLLRSYECGLKLPPLSTIHALLSMYQAEDKAVFFFCKIPFLGSLSESFRGEAQLTKPNDHHRHKRIPVRGPIKPLPFSSGRLN